MDVNNRFTLSTPQRPMFAATVTKNALPWQQRVICTLIHIIDQWFPTLIDAFLPWLILELFIPPLLHNFSRVAEKVQTSVLRWCRSYVVGWSIIPVALLRPFNKPLLLRQYCWDHCSSFAMHWRW